MEVTVKIPDQFVEQLIPAGKDASRVLLEELVDGAYGRGRINAEQVNEILGVEANPELKDPLRLRESADEAVKTASKGLSTNRWANDPDRSRLHAR